MCSLCFVLSFLQKIGNENKIQFFVCLCFKCTTQNYDVIYKDFLCRRFSRATSETKIAVIEQTVGAYLEMMPPALSKDATKFETDGK